MGRPRDVAEVQVHRGVYFGFRYTCRDSEKKVVYTAGMDFRTRRKAAEDARKSWPNAKITYEVT